VVWSGWGPGMTTLWRKLYLHIKAGGGNYIRKVGIFTIAVTIVSFWISYQDRTATRENAAWDQLRSAVGWIESDKTHWGNAGQIGAIQTLTRDCGYWWRSWFFAPFLELFFPYCADLKSLQLTNMELGGLQAEGADFSYSALNCANLSQANLRNANLKGIDFGGSNLAGADLRGAKLSSKDPQQPSDDSNLWLTDLSWALIDDTTEVKLSQLKCACIRQAIDHHGNLVPATDDQHVTSTKLLAAMHGLKFCPNDKCTKNTLESWNCDQRK
jgi:hypothetical protein